MVDYGHYINIPIPEGTGVNTVEENSSLQEVFILRPGNTSLPFDKLVVRKNAKADICIIVMPGVEAKIPVYVDLSGEGAEVSLSGIYLCGGEEKVSFQIEVRHRVGRCISNQLFNGIAGGNSRAAFFGKIVVAPDAQQTEAYQTNHNILLSDNAKVETKPQLEIYADDVKCSHGATIGRLNPDEQFYMRSRGITEAEAKILQMVSFIAPVLNHITDPDLREKLNEEIEKQLRQII